MVALGFLGATFASLVVQHQLAAVNEVRSAQALYAAEAGFELVNQELLDNADKAFNGAAANGVIGGITNVPVGVGTVSVSKGTQTPPVFTATGTVGAVSRVLIMTVDEKNLVTLDPIFNDATNLATNWPEATPQSGEGNGGSGIAATTNVCCSPNALKVWTNQGAGNKFITYRQSTLSQTIPPPGSKVNIRFNYMLDRTGSCSNVDKQEIHVQLVDTTGGTQDVWSKSGCVSDAERGVWFSVDLRAWQTPTTLTINKVRLTYSVVNNDGNTYQTLAWFDNIQVLLITKSSWSEP